MGCKRWSLHALVLCVGVVACSKDKNAVTRTDTASGSGSAAIAPASDDKLEYVWDRTEPLCPRDQGPRKTATRMTGSWIRIIPIEVGFVVHRRKPKGTRPGDHAFQVYSDEGKWFQTIPGDKDPGSVISFDQTNWFTAPCEEGTCDKRGFGHDLLRIDRTTGKSEKLYTEHSFVYGQPFGLYFYWASSGANGTTGALRRVPRTGNKVETLWEGGGVVRVLFLQDAVLVADQHSLFAIPFDGGKPKELMKDLKNAQGIAADGNQVYLVDRGDDDGKSGRALVVDRVTGNTSVLASDLPSPTVVAVDGDRLDIMFEGIGSVIAVPRTGGKPTLLIPAPRHDWSCDTTRWIRSDASGLHWLRMPDEEKRGRLFWLPRAMLADPIRQWREVMAKQPKSAASAEEPSGSDVEP